MHTNKDNGILSVRANGNVAEVDSGVYSVNGREVIKKSSIGYQNQNRIHKLMTGLMEKYGIFQYETKSYKFIGIARWESEGVKERNNSVVETSVRWGYGFKIYLKRSNGRSVFYNTSWYPKRESSIS
ncbi:hypothetical protein [Maribacter aestuarii]|uniref:hypothetical protein n=1 Tax=Maribacter aestuarii TaxID=1130723 RepID=UPI00248C343A|nr:hypothetical protein [Maribacter aestuarii]